MNQKQKDQRELAYLESQFDAKERDLKVLGEKIREIKNRLQVRIGHQYKEEYYLHGLVILKDDLSPFIFT